jgi:histidinol-phosphate aminotransferase
MAMREATPIGYLRADVRSMTGYTPGEQVIDCVKLNTNECAWPPSPKVLEVLRGFDPDSLRVYPDPLAQGLRQRAAADLGVSPGQVLVGNGSDDCLTMIYRAFLGPGDHVGCPWPTYGLYDTLAQLQGVAAQHFEYDVARDHWLLPAGLAQARAKLVVVANPNNPSGTLVATDEIEHLADAVDGVLVVDEAYVDFAGDPRQASVLPRLDRHPNLIVLRTFSKSYSLAGARLGLMFAQASLIEQLAKVKDSYNVNAVTQALGIAAIEDRDYHRGLVDRTLDERRRLEQTLADLGWTWPVTSANFLLCEVGAEAERIYLGLKDQGLLVRWWRQPGLRTKLRISVGRPEHTDRLVGLLRHLR